MWRVALWSYWQQTENSIFTELGTRYEGRAMITDVSATPPQNLVTTPNIVALEIECDETVLLELRGDTNVIAILWEYELSADEISESGA